MIKRLFSILIAFACIIVWLGTFFFERLACFDVFETNATYLYVLAILFAFIQYICIFYLSRKKIERLFLFFSCIAYFVFSVLEIYFIFITFKYFTVTSSIGLILMELILDIIGGGLSIYLLKNKVQQ